MTNNNWPHGFQPLMVDTAGAPVGVKQYAKPASDANAIYQFDLVKKVASSQSVQGSQFNSPGCQTYNTGTPGTTLILGSSLNFGAASKATLHLIVDDPSAIFSAQSDGSTVITVASSIGKNANVNNAAQTNSLYLLSAMQVNSSSIATTAGLDVRLQDFYRLGSNVEAANAIVEVLILKHANAPGSAGV